MNTSSQTLGTAALNVSPQKAGMRTSWPVRTLRKHPHIYSTVCKARLAYSRRIASAREQSLYKENARLWQMTPAETAHSEHLKRYGYALVEDLVPTEAVDVLFEKADRLFKDLRLDFQYGYSVWSNQRPTLKGVPYEELEATEKVVSLQDPLLSLPECVSYAFHESLLRIVTNFMGYVPPSYKVTVVRDFALSRPKESSNFHKDNDEADSVQLFIYLVDIEERCGHLVYIPGSHRYDAYSCRPRLNRDLGIDANDGRYSDEEIARFYPRESWAALKTKRGSVAMVHGNGIHKGPCWPHPGDSNNIARTAIKIDINGHKSKAHRTGHDNRMTKAQFEGLSEIQKMLAYPILV
jgi:ectoine hydroxylase-related dioxygenase (phytanoyl-CoA dioxygenase family)